VAFIASRWAVHRSAAAFIAFRWAVRWSAAASSAFIAFHCTSAAFSRRSSPFADSGVFTSWAVRWSAVVFHCGVHRLPLLERRFVLRHSLPTALSVAFRCSSSAFHIAASCLRRTRSPSAARAAFQLAFIAFRWAVRRSAAASFSWHSLPSTGASLVHSGVSPSGVDIDIVATLSLLSTLLLTSLSSPVLVVGLINRIKYMLKCPTLSLTMQLTI